VARIDGGRHRERDVALVRRASVWASGRDVRFYPNSDRLLRSSEVTLCAKSAHSALRQRLLFDHLVGNGEQRLRNCQPQCLRDLDVDH
jgi:hypothetical protein